MSPQKIKQLPESLIAHIAAGEVIERPASILKELIENSLDAGATEIAIGIEGAGRRLISISDNGCGMNRQDALLAIKRHATSKIEKLADLESMATYGFRGEAMPSVAAVSRMEMTSKAKDEEEGWRFFYEGGRLIEEEPVARESGTTIRVQDIFFNTPARYKFLKSDGTERSQCLRVIEEMAFVSPHVTFRVSVEKGKPLVFQKRSSQKDGFSPENLKDRVGVAWGSRLATGLVPVKTISPHFSLTGVVSNPYSHQGTVRYQYLFINKRPVQNRRLSRAVYEAFRGSLPSLRHPAWVLFLDVKPETVDVNVHPSKREVKLTHESEIFGFVLSAIKNSLFQHSPINKEGDETVFSSESVSTGLSLEQKSMPGAGSQASASLREIYRPLGTKPPVSGSTPILEPQFGFAPSLKGQQFSALAQLKKMFILAEGLDGLVVVDQHAAAERVAYEALMLQRATKKYQTQMLLVPYTWEVAVSLYSHVKEKVETFQSLGFLLEPFGDNAFMVRGYPSVLGEKFDLASLLDGVSEDLHQKDFQHRLAAMTACKASVRAGDTLDLKECQALLDQIVECESPTTCPHGRPTTWHISSSDLEHKFRR